MASLVKRALAALGVLFLIPVGCRGVLGIEERELVDGGGVSCETYCQTIQAQCTGAEIQYASVAACTKMCATFTPGALDDEAVDTLGCRQSLLTRGVSLKDVNCQSVGPAGSVCGSACDLYCNTLSQVCLEQFATFQGDCLAACAKIPSCGDYVADGLRDDNSMQCRIFHLTSAASDAVTHCQHAIGAKENCLAATGTLCTDAGP
jgi:hypothetical protein